MTADLDIINVDSFEDSEPSQDAIDLAMMLANWWIITEGSRKYPGAELTAIRYDNRICVDLPDGQHYYCRIMSKVPE